MLLGGRRLALLTRASTDRAPAEVSLRTARGALLVTRYTLARRRAHRRSADCTGETPAGPGHALTSSWGATVPAVRRATRSR